MELALLLAAVIRSRPLDKTWFELVLTLSLTHSQSLRRIAIPSTLYHRQHLSHAPVSVRARDAGNTCDQGQH